MMARPVAQYLARFGPKDPAEAEGVVEVEAVAKPIAPDPSLAPGDEFAHSMQLARDEGKAEGFASARIEHAAELAQEKLLFAAHLAAERATWTQEESDKLAGKLGAALAEIEANIAACVARVLRAFLIDLLRRKVVDDLVADIGALLSDKEHAVIKISGAEDIVAALREKLSGCGAAIEFVQDHSIDVKVVADQTLIESRLEAWSHRIRALAE